ncbi:MAG: hypothetical protein ABI232_07560 [Jatrophihabitantaceae bacterium]
MTKLRRWAVGAVAVLAMLALAGCGSKAQPGTPAGAPGSSSPLATAARVVPVVHYQAPTQKVFAPYDESGKLTAQISDTESGSCWTSSIAVPISGVFRCLVANQILDPCFAPANETKPLTVSCFNDPWTAGTKVMLTTAMLPKDVLVLKGGSSWGLELANGARCIVVTGAVPVLDNYVLQYQCDAGAVASLQTAVDGSVSAMYGTSSGPLTSVAILVQWRGQSFRFGATT